MARLEARYRAEREKRLRPDGNAQYVPVAGRFAHLEDDPYVAPGFTRAAIAELVDVLIVGGGFGGLMIAGNLIRSGVRDIRIVEKAGDFGGTWYWNRYPGAACDIESYIYLPFLEEVGYIPVEKYSRALEIFEYSRRLAAHFGLYERAHLQTEVTGMRWQESRSRWLVTTNRGDAIEARFVCMSAGPLHKPKLPGIPGIETFSGHSFHTTRWDYAYTGGDAGGSLKNSPTSGWASWAPARPRCSAFRTSRAGPGTSTCSSARPPRWVCAPTGRPIRSGRRR